MNWLGKSIQIYVSEKDSVISVGCGVLNDIKDIKCKSLTGVDIYEPYVNKLKDEGYNVICDDFITMDIKDNSYDVVLALDFIEHIPQDKVDMVLDKLYRIAKKKVILFTPHEFRDNINNMEEINIAEDSPYKDLGVNKYQQHLSLISPGKLIGLGYKVSITNGKAEDGQILAVYNKNKIDVLIPHYNSKNTIDRTIDSVLNQTFKDYNITILDDCSNDGSYEYLIDKYKDNNHISIHKNYENLGISKTKNKLLSYGNAEHVAWLASDDTWHPNFLERMYEVSLENPMSIVFSEYNIIDKDDKMTRVHEHIVNDNNNVYRFDSDEFKDIVIAHAIKLDIPVNYSAILCSRLMFMGRLEFWEKVRTCEDLHHLLSAVLLFKIPFVYVPEHLVNYRWHSDNTSNREDDKKMLNINKIHEFINHRLGDNFLK